MLHLRVYPKLKKLKIFLSSLPNVICARMTGSGSCIVAYYKSKKALIKDLNYLKRNIKIIGVLYQKLYKFFFLCYMNLILGRSQVVRQRFLVPPFLGSDPSAPAKYDGNFK